MLRFQSAIVSLLASVLVAPLFLGQGQLATLQDAHSATQRALDVLAALEQRLKTEPAAALSLILSATEEPLGDEVERDRRLEALRNEVSLLQMELDAAQSPVLAPDGSVQSALGGASPQILAGSEHPRAITTGLDDSLRALLATPEPRSARRGESVHTPAPREDGAPASAGERAYSADPLRHGITCYRAGRFSEALELLTPLDEAPALYWQARTLERLERLDEAIRVMERAIQTGGEGFEQRRAQTDLEFLRWKRDFVQSLPAAPATKPAGNPR